MTRSVPAAALALVICAGPPAFAQADLTRLTVVAPSPVPGSGVAAGDLAGASSEIDAAAITRTLIPDLTGALLAELPAASVNETSGNPFQPDILFHGYTASPVTGTAEGLAVYVDGARFNDPFGDAVNWDLLPPEAIRSVTVRATDPVFGLNALGGSVDVRMKTGFDSPGGALTAYGGSYGRGAGSLEYGARMGNFGLYVAADVTHDGGFRQTGQSDLYRIHTDLGWRGGATEAHLSLSAAANLLGNPGASPVQELSVDPSGIFTGPNEVSNQYVNLVLRTDTRLDATASIQSVIHASSLTQRVSNGATADIAPCGPVLCNGDGTVATSTGGVAVPAFLGAGPYSDLVLEGLDAQSYGASVQITETAQILGRANHLVVGASYDGSSAVFNAQTLIGGFSTNGSQLFVGPPDFVQVQPAEGVNPVKLNTRTGDGGIYFSDLWQVLPGLDLSAGGRFDAAFVDLEDRIGTALNGRHGFARFNPEAGFAWHVAQTVTLFGSYAEASRTPTPTELSCASAATPCSLLNFFIGDPALKEVVARTFQAGLRGGRDWKGGSLDWSASYYHTEDRNDLIFETTPTNPNLAYYTNAGSTLRQGLDVQIGLTAGALHLTAGYSLIDAVFLAPLLLGSPENPAASPAGTIAVRPGDRIPGIPAQRATATLSYAITPRWQVGGDLSLQTSQFRVGDEANLTKPVGGYGVLDLNARYAVSPAATLFVVLQNALDARYATYGGFGPTDAVPFAAVPGGVTNTRTADPGQPISAYAGVRFIF